MLVSCKKPAPSGLAGEYTVSPSPSESSTADVYTKDKLPDKSVETAAEEVPESKSEQDNAVIATEPSQSTEISEPLKSIEGKENSLQKEDSQKTPQNTQSVQNSSGNNNPQKSETAGPAAKTPAPGPVKPQTSVSGNTGKIENMEKPAVVSHNYVIPKQAPVNVTGNHYYVSKEKGNDDNPGTLEKPFASISKAASMMQAGDACYIREGVYRETVRPANNGTETAPVLFASYNNEKVIISGADIIDTQWSVYKGNIYSADMSWTLGAGKNQVFVDGEAVIQARHPNADIRSQSPAQYSRLFPTRGFYAIDHNFKTIIKSPHLNQSQPDYWKGGIYVGGHNAAWTWQTAHISRSKDGQITVNNTTNRWWFPIEGHYSAELSEGYITNHINALDMAGEWHIENSKLYIWVPDGNNPASKLVEAKRRQLAFDLTDRKNIYIFGVEVFAASITMAKAENCVLDRSLASYTSHFTLFDDARNGFIDTGSRTPENSPMSGQVGIYVSGRNNKLINNTIRYSAGAGIFLAGYGTVVENNIIHDVGYANTYLGGITANDEFNNTGSKADIKLGNYKIRYNTIYNVGRSAINIGALGDNIAQYAGSDISYNQIFNTMLFTCDGGAFYVYGSNLSADGKRTQLHHNMFWNSWVKSGAGIIYSDNLVEGLDVYNNVMWSHEYSNKTMLVLKTDSPNKDNLPKNLGNNKNLGIREWLPTDLPASAYAGEKPYFTGAMHAEHPAQAGLPTVSRPKPYVPPTGELARTSWKASASSHEDTSPPEDAIDNDEKYTYWRTKDVAQSPNDWFRLDLGSVQEFSRIIMKCSGVNSPRSYTITVSDDGKTWSQPVGMGDSCESDLDIILFSMQKARYIKISQHEKTTPAWGQFWMIQDIKVYRK